MATEADYRAQQAGTAPKNTGTASSAAFQTNVQNFAAPVAQTMAVQPPKAPAFPLKVAGQALDIGQTVAKAAGNFVKNSAVDIYQQGRGAADALNPQDSFARQHEITKQRLTLDRKQSQIVADYKAGRMTKDNYSKSLKSLGASYSGLSNDATKLVKESDPTKMVSDVVWTAINALTLGTGLIVKQGGKTAAEVAVKEGLFNGGVKAVENLITKVPGARELIERNAAKVTTREAQKLAGESTEAYLARTGKAVVVGLLIKRPIFYQTNIGLAQDTYKHIIDGQYDEATKSAAWIGAQMIGGGPIGWFMNQGKRGLSHVGSLARGKESFIDGVSRRIGNGNPNQLADIAGKDPTAERTLRILQETNLQSADGRVSTAVDNLLTHYTEHGIALDSLTGEQIVKDMTNWATADELAQKTIRMGVIKGVSPESVGRYAVVRWDSSTKNALAGAIEATDGSPQAIADAVFALSERPGVGWGNNDILMKRVTDIISSGGSKEAIAAEIKQISTASTVLDGVPSKVRKQLADLGYTIAAPFGGNGIKRVNYDDIEGSTRKLISSAINGPQTITKVIDVVVPDALKGLVAQAKNFKTETEFIDHLKSKVSNAAKDAGKPQPTASGVTGLLGAVPADASAIGKADKPRFATLDEAFKEIMRPKEGKQGVILSKQEIRQILDLFASHPDPINTKFRGKVYGRFHNSRDVILGHANGQTVVAELDDKGIPTGRIRAHSTPLNADHIVGDYGAVGAFDKTVGASKYDIPKTPAKPFDEADAKEAFRLSKQEVTTTTEIMPGEAIFDPAHSPEPVLSGIATLLSKAGLSPEAANTVAHRALSEHLVGNLGELGIARNLGLHGEGDMVAGGRAMLSELQRYVENKKGAFLFNKISSGKSAVTDIRQLTHDEISTALGISKSEAKDVSRAVRMAYTQVPLELRGLGDKIVDYAIAAPLSPMRYYLRVQSALRYTYNPFFRTQEQVETNLLASMDANKFIWAHSGLDESVTTLEKNGYFSGNVFGSGADDNVIGRISANLTQFQKRNLAGLGETIAKSQGKTLEQVILDTPEQLDDALRVIVQYGKHGALSSPLARTINIAFFPMRYNVKVSMLVADKLASLPPSLQFATLQGIHKTRDWLKSDEGLQWQADNAEAIKVFAWASPVGNITQFAKILSGSTDSIGDWGLLGGLPFGVISQLLDAEGIINLNKPYVNPSTGDVLPDYIPQSTKAQAAVALQSLLGSMFSFPGRTLGLPGKEKGVRDAVGLFINTNGTDFDKRVNTDQLTPLQQQMIRVLKGDTSDAAVKAMYYAPAPGQFDYYTLPPSSLPYTVKATNDPLPNPTLRRGLPSNKKAKAGPKVKPLPVPITRP